MPGRKMPVIGVKYISDVPRWRGPAFYNVTRLLLHGSMRRSEPIRGRSCSSEAMSRSRTSSLKYGRPTIMRTRSRCGIWSAGVLAKGQRQQRRRVAECLNRQSKFQSVYGGNATQVGTIELNTTTHTVTKRPLGIYMSNNGKPKQVAAFGIGGAEFELTK